MGLILLFSGFISLIGGTLSFFLSDVTKYESTVTGISNSVIQFLNDKGLKIPKDQISTFVQPAKILEFTSSALKELLKMLGNTFLIFLIILFIMMEFASFSLKAKAITSGSGKSIAYFTTILRNIRHYLAIKTLVCISILFWGFILGPVGMFLAVPFTITIKIILEQNEKTQWLAILLGTPAEAKIYLQNKELFYKQQHKESLLNENYQTNIES